MNTHGYIAMIRMLSTAHRIETVGQTIYLINLVCRSLEDLEAREQCNEQFAKMGIQIDWTRQ